jgi:2,3-bisphosphoglycerate-independent phosphoglycerate mutase
MTILEIPGVTDGPDNNYAAQGQGGLEALKDYDIVIIHIEAPDEAGHAGQVDKKIEAIERIDSEVLSRIRNWSQDKLRVLVMSDHPTRCLYCCGGMDSRPTEQNDLPKQRLRARGW